MMRLKRILRDYAEAGAINAQIALWGFVDDHTFLTKAGHVGLVYRIRGTDTEGLTHDQRRVLVHQMEAALGSSMTSVACISTCSSRRSSRSWRRLAHALWRRRRWRVAPTS